MTTSWSLAALVLPPGRAVCLSILYRDMRISGAVLALASVISTSALPLLYTFHPPDINIYEKAEIPPMAMLKLVESISFAFLALSFLPLSTSILILNYLYVTCLPRTSVHKRLSRIPGFKSRTILITGVSTPHGLRLARAFHRTGHLVIGADHEPGRLPGHVRFSKAVTQFYKLARNPGESREASCVAKLVCIVEQEHVDLWISCSSSADLSIEAHATNIIEQNSNCQCFTLGPANMQYLESREAFMKYLTSQGLPAPESYQVTSRAEIHDVLSKARGSRKYLLGSVEQNGINANTAKTMLPSRTMSQTYDAVSRINIANTAPWKLEQDINELERYFTFAIVVRGSLKAFVACLPIDDGCYRTLEPTSALSRSMLRFTHAFARKRGPDFTSHLGIEFCVDEQATENGVVQAVLPVQVSVRAQAAMQLFRGMGGSVLLARAYLSVFAVNEGIAEKKKTRPHAAIQQQQEKPDEISVPDTKILGTYCFSHVLAHLCLEPLRDFITFRSSLVHCVQQLLQFLTHLMFWEDDTYDFQDPLPFWLLYQVYIPLRLIKTALFPDNNQS